MKSKKAQTDAIYLVLLTIFMCLLVIGFYYFQKNQVGNAIILPNSLLALETNKEIFEFQEQNIIIQAAKEVISESSSSSDFFLNDFENKFYDYLTSDEQSDFREFIFTDARFNGKEIIKDNLNNRDSQEAFFKEIYSISIQDNILNVTRNPVIKFLLLKPDAKNKISFVVRLDYNLEKEYLIDLNSEILQETVAEFGTATNAVIDVPIARARYSDGAILESKGFIYCSAVILDCGNKAVMAHATCDKEDYTYEYTIVPEGNNIYTENVVEELSKLLQEKGINPRECKAFINAGLSENLEKITHDLGDVGISIEISKVDKTLRDIRYNPKTDRISITYPASK